MDYTLLRRKVITASPNAKGMCAPSDTTTPQGNLLFTIFAGLSQFERDLIRQRTKSGLEAARARGRKGGRPKASSGKVETALKMYDSKLHTIEEISTTTGISRATIYRYIEDREKRTAQ